MMVGQRVAVKVGGLLQAGRVASWSAGTTTSKLLALDKGMWHEVVADNVVDVVCNEEDDGGMVDDYYTGHGPPTARHTHTKAHAHM